MSHSNQSPLSQHFPDPLCGLNAADLSQPRGVILTGDRPTGPLHLGHYAGSLRSRVALQGSAPLFIMIADAQALTDNMDDPGKVRRNVLEVALDYLATGIDPAQSSIFIQSQVPELAELSFFYLNFVTVARLQRNPTIREEIRLRGFAMDIPAGFLAYPVSQAADITAFKATLVPVGSDQLPMIEQSNEIVRKLNRMAGRQLMPESKALISSSGRLPGIDGKAKMSKSLGNAINLGASADEISASIKRAFTDPLHLRVEDPGRLEGNVVFDYLDAFDPDAEGLAEMKARYQRGGLGDSAVKSRLIDILQALLAPMRERRAELAKDPAAVMSILKQGTERARETAAGTLSEVKSAMGLDYF